MNETIERNHHEPQARLTLWTDEADRDLGGRAMRVVVWVLLASTTACVLFNLVRWAVTR